MVFMSWLSTPSRIVPTVNRIIEAAHERAKYSNPDGYWGSYYDLYSLPCGTRSAYDMSNRIREMIWGLYREHFPPANFGKWSQMRPYADFTDAQIEDAIAAELRKVNIDPAGFFWEAPHPLGDGTFVRACYHLLNNVLLYTFPGTINLTGKVRSDSGLIYDASRESFPFCTLVGKLENGSSYYEHIDLHYVIPEDTYPRLQGNWKVKHKIDSVYRYVRDIYNYKTLEASTTPASGTFEVAFSGNQSEVFVPWGEEVFNNVDYYRSLCEEQYYYWVLVTQYSSFSEVFLNKENFTPPNYKYLD